MLTLLHQVYTNEWPRTSAKMKIIDFFLFWTLYFWLIKLRFDNCRLAASANGPSEQQFGFGCFELRTIFFADSSDKWVVSLHSTFISFPLVRSKRKIRDPPSELLALSNFTLFNRLFVVFFFVFSPFRATLGCRRYCKWWHVCIPLSDLIIIRNHTDQSSTVIIIYLFFWYNCLA